MPIETGLVGELSIVVAEKDTARASSGERLPAVLSTPRLISLIEQTAYKAIIPFLAVGESSVGSIVNIRHLAATPVGMAVRFRVEVIKVDGRRVNFKVEAWDTVDKIAEGEHERFVIDSTRFNDRLEKKRQLVR
jgi:fluoroacetyl-CoA thioesterase